MKTHPHSIAVATLLAALCFLACAASSQAVNPSPMFGETLSVNGVTYTCVMDDGNGGSDYATSEDGTYQTGVYQATGGGSGTLTVRGKIGQAELATVIGSDGASHDGYLQNGVYGERVQSDGGTSVEVDPEIRARV